MRKIFLIAIAFAGCLLISNSVMAQGTKDIRINEVLVLNEDNYEDDYGHREGWIELFNAGYSQVNIGGCYLTTVNKEGKGQIYRIPKGDPNTIIPPQGYIVFFAEGTSTKGTFHTNFTLDETGYIAFLDQSGRGTPISELTYIIEEQQPDISIGAILNEAGELTVRALDATTPYATNEIAEAIPAHEKFRKLDPIGYAMAITAMTVVFIALILLYLIFRTVGKTMVRHKKRSDEKELNKGNTGIGSKNQEDNISGEELAAIAMAMRQYQDDLHDIESTVLTINRVARTYSPWSSKIYGLRQMPNKK